MAVEKVWFESNNKKLFGQFEWRKNSDKPLIILLHGLTNSLKDCPLINESNSILLDKGFSTFRFDFFGSGKSEGIFKQKTLKIIYRNVKDALEFALKNLKYKKIGLWGRSLGAMLASTICDNENIYSSVLISTTVFSEESFKPLFIKKQPYSKTINGSGKIKGEPILPYKYYLQTRWFDDLQKVHLPNAENILILQGTNDKIIHDQSWTKEVYKLIKGKKRLDYIKGADHSYQGYEQPVVNKVIDWFNNNAYISR